MLDFCKENDKVKRTMLKQNVSLATYNVAEAAQVAGTGTRAIRDGVASGKIPSIKFGRLIKIPKAPFHRFLDSCGKVA